MIFRGRNALVVGLGKSGLAAAKLLVRLGARVTISEIKPFSFFKSSIKTIPKSLHVEWGQKKFYRRGVDVVVTSPGVAWNHPELERFRKQGVEVLSEMELGWRVIKPECVIAVTGTNGKTTTTSLIGHLISSSGKKVLVGGNIGTPLCTLFPSVTPKTIVVLEVSSYQAETIDSFHPNISVFMNLTPDHLARHRTMSAYARAKARLLKNCNRHDVVIYNSKDAWCRKMVKVTKARKISFPSPTLISLGSNVNLLGTHNFENAMAASAAALEVGISKKDIVAGLKTFKPVRHRIEPVRTYQGVTYINDSKATNVDSTLVALQALDKPIFLILGGQHKGSSYKPLIKLVQKKVKRLLLIGEAAPIIKKELGGVVPLTVCHTLKKAVAVASIHAHDGDVVLLSPACASFDQFNNFEHRGDVFCKLVKLLRFGVRKSRFHAKKRYET